MKISVNTNMAEKQSSISLDCRVNKNTQVHNVLRVGINLKKRSMHLAIHSPHELLPILESSSVGHSGMNSKFTEIKKAK